MIHRLFRREKREVTQSPNLSHEYFRDICAAASIRQATPEQLFEFEEHAATCESCQQLYWDYVNLDAQHVAERIDTPRLSAEEAQKSLNSELGMRRFFERAEKEGIRFSEDVRAEAKNLSPMPLPLPRKRWWPKVSLAFAASVVLASMVASAYFYGKRSAETPVVRLQPDAVALAVNQHVSELNATIGRLQAEVERLKLELNTAGSELRVTKRDLSITAKDRDTVAAAHADLEARLTDAQDALAQSQALAASAQKDVAKQRDRTSDIEATLVATNVKVNNLTEELEEKSASLDKARQLLALNRDVTNLMAERNLHVVDVLDTDSGGKTRPAFGRIFFAEGKSLEFYAYDLDEAKLQKANYQYRIWAKQEGGEKQVRSMGIFYSDDKAQRRWKFQCNDPKILREIDSVFVTLEPANSDPKHPKGPNLMYAYLRGQPHHPGDEGSSQR
jgi:uncharacterized small protein (DUF1192 family)